MKAIVDEAHGTIRCTSASQVNVSKCADNWKDDMYEARLLGIVGGGVQDRRIGAQDS